MGLLSVVPCGTSAQSFQREPGKLPSAAISGCTWPTSTSTAPACPGHPAGRPASSSARNLTPWKSPQDDLAAAEKLIHDCGYHRRDRNSPTPKKPCSVSENRKYYERVIRRASVLDCASPLALWKGARPNHVSNGLPAKPKAAEDSHLYPQNGWSKHYGISGFTGSFRVADKAGSMVGTCIEPSNSKFCGFPPPFLCLAPAFGGKDERTAALHDTSRHSAPHASPSAAISACTWLTSTSTARDSRYCGMRIAE